MTKSPRYNKDAVDKELKKTGAGKKASKLTHKLLKGRQQADESKVTEADIVDFSSFAGMYHGGAHAVFQHPRTGEFHMIQATGNKPRKYFLDGKEISWDELKQAVGRTQLHPKQGFKPDYEESVNEASEMKSFSVRYKTKSGKTSTCTIRARDKKEAEAKCRSKPNYNGDASATLNEDRASDYGVSDAQRNPSMGRPATSRSHRKPTDREIEDRDRSAGMAMDAMTAAKRKKERAMFGEDGSGFSKGDTVIALRGPHKGDRHEVIHDFGDGTYNVRPLTRRVKYRLGAAKASAEDLKPVTEGAKPNATLGEAEVGDKVKYRNIKSKRNKTGTVRRVDTKNSQKRYELDGGKMVYDSDLEESGDWSGGVMPFRYAVINDNNDIELYNTRTDRLIKTVPMPDYRSAERRLERALFDPSLDEHVHGQIWYMNMIPGERFSDVDTELEEANTSYDRDLDDNQPIIVKGVKGASSKSFRKKFKNMDAYGKWIDSDAADDYEVHQVMNESHKITEGVLDDMDDDGFMAKRQLYDIAKYAVELHRMIQDTDNLEPWIQAKITKAQDYIDTVKHYMEYQGVSDAEAMADFSNMDDLAPAVDAIGPEMPQEEVMEYGDEDGSYVYPEDVLRWAVTRGVISDEQFDNPSTELHDAAADAADWIGQVDEIGSSDVSIWLRDFVDTAKGYGAELDGPNAIRYMNESKAARIYEKMIKQLKGRK